MPIVKLRADLCVKDALNILAKAKFIISITDFINTGYLSNWATLTDAPKGYFLSKMDSGFVWQNLFFLLFVFQSCGPIFFGSRRAGFGHERWEELRLFTARSVAGVCDWAWLEEKRQFRTIQQFIAARTGTVSKKVFHSCLCSYKEVLSTFNWLCGLMLNWVIKYDYRC